MPEDPYATLGLANGASVKEVNRAFRILAKKHHPDVNPGDKAAEERFLAVTAAHDYLMARHEADAPRFGVNGDRAYEAELEQRLRDRRGPPPPSGFFKNLFNFFVRSGRAR
jgi:DnaJ-class molecular chaperone